MRYIIGQCDIYWSDDRWLYKGGWGNAPKRRKGWIGLWDRNIYRFRWFKIIGKCLNKYAYICERNKPITGYWKNILEANGQI
jgi:hypothetical protein